MLQFKKYGTTRPIRGEHTGGGVIIASVWCAGPNNRRSTLHVVR